MQGLFFGLSGGNLMEKRAKHLVTVFFETAEKYANRVAVRFCDKEVEPPTWQTWDWQTYAENVRYVAGWLRGKGVARGDRVAILSANRPEWIVADLAILSIGAISVPIYTNASGKDMSFILGHSEAKAICVDDPSRFDPLSVNPPEISLILSPKGFSGMKSEAALTLSVAEVMGDDELATIIYTSGTTGIPKGVMHTHGSIAAAAACAVDALSEGKTGADRFVSFLPLSHAAERLLIELCGVSMGAEVVFARGPDTLIDDLRRYPPTVMLCVPRLWERVYERIVNSVHSSRAIKRLVFNAALKAGSQRIRDNHILKERDGVLGARISDALVGKKLRRSLGMDQVRTFLTGSAPTHPDILEFFGSLGIFIREVYGLTENLCLGVYSSSNDIAIGACGRPFSSTEIKIADDGEVLLRSPFNFKGYYKNPEATHSTLSSDGWLSTGDFGTLDKQGCLHITGRKKELIKTSTGHYVAPFPIENELKKESLVRDVMLVGDNQKYCIALVDVDLTLATKQGIESDLEAVLKAVNKSLAKHESIKKVGVLKSGFSIENGTLTPTLKLKRKAVLETYGDFINQVYASDGMIVRE